MIRGTTPTITINVSDADLSLFAKIVVTIRQGDTIIDKTGADITVNGSTVTTTLTQEDTLSLSETDYAEIQLRAVSQRGTAVASNIGVFSVYEVLNEVVIRAD